MPNPRKSRPWLLALGWLLSLPGLWVILSFVLQASVSEFAGCAPSSGLSFPPCPPGPWAALADGMRVTVALTAILSFVGMGAVPPIYSSTFVLTRVAFWIFRKQSEADLRSRPLFRFLVVLVLIVFGVVATQLANGSMQPDEAASGFLGLGAMVASLYGGYKLCHWVWRCWRRA